MGLKQTVARNVRTLRLARGYSQEELSALAGINRNYTGMIERQQRSPTIDTIEKLARALKVDADALLSTNMAKAQTASLDDHDA